MGFIDLTGTKLKYATVLYRTSDHIKPSGKRVPVWKCLCDCGQEFDVWGSSIRRSPDTICCSECRNANRKIKNRINIVGKKYGRLTIIESIYNECQTQAKCLCDCGNVTVVYRADVVNGHTKSCGCLHKEKTSETNTKDWTGHISDYGVEFLSQNHMNNKGQWMWNCKCGICGEEFVALPAKVNNGQITSCGCAAQSSKERLIKNILDDLSVDFIPQHSFSDCKYKYLLRFDFCVLFKSQILYLIEYDGKQHFEPIDLFGGDLGFKELQKRDKIKNEYCKSHNIPLLRIPYTLSDEEIKNIIYEYHLSVTTAGCA